jgi:hypothetical protein
MKKHIRTLLFIFGSIVLLNIASYRIYKRWDLTEEKRYSLTDASIHLLQNITEPIVIKVYLTGDDLPGGFKRLEKAISETLEDLVVYVTLYENELAGMWVRPAAMFMENVIVEGKSVPRFKKLD